MMVPRDVTLSPFSRIAIDFAHMRSTTILSAMCVDTQVVFLSVVDSASAESVVNAIERLSNIYCVRAKKIYSDNAQAFAKKFVVLIRKLFGWVEFSTTAPYESSQDPVDRCPREVWSLIRARKAARFIGDEINNEVLESVDSIINQRPLGVYEDQKTVVPPARLAWSCNHVCGQRLTEFRECFYANLFSWFRRRHLPNRFHPIALGVGSFVLYPISASEETKDTFSHAFGRIVGIDGNVFSIESGGKLYKVGSS